jgi:hypothetical protein
MVYNDISHDVLFYSLNKENIYGELMAVSNKARAAAERPQFERGPKTNFACNISEHESVFVH